MIPFSKLKDQDAYCRHLKDIYSTSDNSERILNQLQNTLVFISCGTHQANCSNRFTAVPSQISFSANARPLVIYEIGPGNGTLAANILKTLKDDFPQIYERTEYNLIEISQHLREKQKAKLVPCIGITCDSPIYPS